MPEPFERVDSAVMLETPIFSLRRDRAVHPRTQVAGNYFVLDMPDFVNMVAETKHGEMILVRQWRHGSRSIELELPAGLVDADEAALEAAKRELLEETGYAAEHWEELGHVTPNPAFLSNRCTTFWARGCERVCEPNLDDDEDIEVVRVSAGSIPEMIRRGTLRNAQMVAAIWWWLDAKGAIST